MIRHRTKKQVRFFDIFKLIVTIILLLILLYTWRSRSTVAATTPAVSGVEQAQATATEQAAQPAEQAEEMATPASLPATETPAVATATEVLVVAPALTLPAGELAAGEVELSGTGEPGSELEIVADGQVVGTATVGSDGSWQTAVELPDAGEYEVQVRAIDSTGSILAESEPTTLQLGAAATEAEPEVGATPPTLTLPAGELAAGEVELSGVGEPGSELEIVVDGQVVGTTTVGSDGSWQIAVELPDAGEYEVQVRAVDESGAALAESQLATLQIGGVGAETAATGDQSQTPTGQAYIVQADDWLSKIADKFYGDMFAYQTIVDATNAKAGEDSSFILIADPNRIEIGQKLWIPASP